MSCKIKTNTQQPRWMRSLTHRVAPKANESSVTEQQVSRGARRRPSPPGSRMSTLGLWSASRSAVCPVVVWERPLLRAVFSCSGRKTLGGNPKPARIHHRTLLGLLLETEAIFPAAVHSCSALRKAGSRCVMLERRGQLLSQFRKKESNFRLLTSK